MGCHRPLRCRLQVLRLRPLGVRCWRLRKRRLRGLPARRLGGLVARPLLLHRRRGRGRRRHRSIPLRRSQRRPNITRTALLRCLGGHRCQRLRHRLLWPRGGSAGRPRRYRSRLRAQVLWRQLRCRWRWSRRSKTGRCRGKSNGARGPFRQALPPDKIVRAQMAQLDDLLHLGVGHGTVLLAVPRQIPLDRLLVS